MKPPPAPTMLESTPIASPTTESPQGPGNLRVALGLRLRSRLVAVNAANAPNTAARSDVDIPLTIRGPVTEPIRIPGASRQNTGQRTASCAWCARTLEIEVNTIVAIDVAIAICNTCSGGKCS